MTDFRYLSPVRLGHGLDRLQRIDRTAHREIHGPFRRRRLRDLIALAEKVDLRGRGGAAFPFARKVKAVVSAARTRDSDTVVLVNATEGEPASAKDKFLMARVPHLILDGAMLAGLALGAREIVIAVTDKGQPARSLRSAVTEAGLGDFIRLVRLPERFITGEGGALVNGVNGNPALPPGRKIRAANQGVDGLPTLLSNAETFAQLALLSQLGPELYGAVGTPGEPGTVLLTVWGADGPCVVETPAGVPLVQVLDLCRANVGQGVLIGGYHGAWLTPAAARGARVSREGIKQAGGALGAGIILPLDESVCPLGEVARVATYLGAESAQQCGPCRLGVPAVARSLRTLASGDFGAEALDAVRQGAQTVRGRGACHHPDGAARFVTSALTAFAQDVDRHLADGSCGRPVRGLLPIDEVAEPVAQEPETSGFSLTVDWTRCAAHGLCGYLVPELVRLDEHGFPVIAGKGVPRRLLPDAHRAIEMCPALALRLSDADAPTPVKASR
jgi:NADH:ubiquinone oxidoreductase subunit F (NADH-binding)/ferredoxin